MIDPAKSLAVLYPEVAKDWHATKNGALTPSDVTKASGKKVWWQCCKFSDHEWEAPPSRRVSGSGCPLCAGKRVYSGNSLAALFPKIAKEWHPKKNGTLTPSDVTRASSKKVWWQCSRFSSHEWAAPPSRRVSGGGCPFCAGTRVCAENSLAYVFPNIAREWHPTKNGTLKPADIARGSDKTVWWQCSAFSSHEWKARVVNRTKGSGCPFCVGSRVCPENSLASLVPEVAKEWHPTKNGALAPTDVTKSSNKKVWWQCSAISHHEWIAKIGNRIRGTGCPFCFCRTSKPELRILAEFTKIFKTVEWRVKIHGKEIDVFLPDFSVGIEFDGYFFHKTREEKDKVKAADLASLGMHLIRVREAPLEKMSPFDVQVQKTGLTKKDLDSILESLVKTGAIDDESSLNLIDQYGRRSGFINEALYLEKLSKIALPEDEKTLAFLYPAIAEDWHQTRNGALTPLHITGKSHLKVWWQCPNFLHHEWEATIANRVSGKGCPYCAGHRVCPENSFAILFPELAKEWHPTKNGVLTPAGVTKSSNKKIWWQCSKSSNHQWSAKINDRSRGGGCPFCAGKRVCSENSLVTLFPAIAGQWHPTKNGTLTPSDVTKACGKKVWWQCCKFSHHEWEAPPNNRVSGSGCPFCAGTRVCVQNSLAHLFPDISKEWHPTKNGVLAPSDVTKASGKKVWWQCPKFSHHEWEAPPSRRVSGGGCPFCALKRACPENSLAILFPEIAQEWHPIKNGVLAPADVAKSSNKKVWWQCSKCSHHEWETSPNARVSGGGCPFCAGKRVCAENSLANLFPQIAEEWHLRKNGVLTPADITKKSNKKVWWQCPKFSHHEWEAPPSSRVSGSGCPFCAGRMVCPENSLAILFPEVAKEWHPTNNGTPYPPSTPYIRTRDETKSTLDPENPQLAGTPYFRSRA